MLNFAVPGTVVGIAYILAFNAPPIELAYTGLILVACFVFRDMTTSMRAGLAALSPDRSQPRRGVGEPARRHADIASGA